VRSTRIRAFQGAAIAVILGLSQVSSAAVVSFTVDTTGGATGLTPIANTAANIGKYAAGSFLTLSGNISASTNGVTAASTFGVTAGSSGSFSTGNPGSLTSYYAGTLLANVTPTSIAFPGGSSLDASVYTAHYPEVSGAAVFLAPQSGGGASGVPGSDPADYGASITLKTPSLVVAASGNAALRNAVADISQTGGILSQALIGTPGTQTFTTTGNLGVALTDGDLDYNLKGAVILGQTAPNIFGTGSLAGAPIGVSAGGVGTLTTVIVDPIRQIENLMLTVPIMSTFTEEITGSTAITVAITLTGQVAAYATYQVPEPGSIVMLIFGGLALIPLGYRRLRKQYVDQA
jgi:hypothetical protein